MALDPNVNYPIETVGDLVFVIARMAQGNYNDNQTLVLNLSLSAAGQPNDLQDRSLCETDPTLIECSKRLDDTQQEWVPNPGGGNYASWKKAQLDLWKKIAITLEGLDDSVLKNTLVVQSMGNSGL